MQMIGRYQIQARIGEGAMAHVFRAYDPEISRVLAIKVLKREFCRDPQFAQRFLREARAAGALSHPNIVTIYDVGEVKGYPYIAMELLDGEALDAVMERQGAFAVGALLNIGMQLADALRYAHEQGIIHRDIKPANILLSKDGRTAKILDFGIAHLEHDVGADAQGLAKTQVGQVIGTPRYMSPEQALGLTLDGRSDLFSVGAVLYELAAGRPAFDGASAATLALQITQRDPAPLGGACPPGLRFIIEKLLAKKPERRFRNGAALLEALRREHQAHALQQSDGARGGLGLSVKMALATSAIMAVVLTLSIGFVTHRQLEAMERVALTSGSSIVSFVASNAALAAAENMTLPAEHQDWLPAQAFVASAATDPNITQILVVDHAGVIRAASAHDLVGAPYLAPTGRRVVRDRPDISVTRARTGDGENVLRFMRAITYAGRDVGLVEVSVRRTELEAAAGLTSMLLIGLALLIVTVVAGLAMGATQLMLAPLRQLRAAMADASRGDFDFRISHQRRDEFGQAFDTFNALAETIGAERDAPAPRVHLDATTILAPANDIATEPAGARHAHT